MTMMPKAGGNRRCIQSFHIGGRMAKTVIIGSKELGKGDDRLGGLLMASMLRVMGEAEERPETIIFMNAGVYLLCEGSQALDHLRRLQELGVQLLACTTCLEYYDLADKLRVGKPTTMIKTVGQMMGSDTIFI